VYDINHALWCISSLQYEYRSSDRPQAL